MTGIDVARARIALLAGTLGQGGAEKQLTYIVRALCESGVEVAVFSLTRGEHFESRLRELGIEPIWIGRHGSPAARLGALASALRRFRPHVLQAAHFYVNLYVRLIAPVVGAMDIGAVRNDVDHEVRANGRWGPWLLRSPSALIMNSYAARQNAMDFGIPERKLHVLPNVIDLHDFDAHAASLPDAAASERETVVISVGTLATRKRFDRFLRSIAIARANGAQLRGILVGDGPERDALESLAGDLGLLPDAVNFAGRRNDIPELLRSADIYLSTSGHEGFPNVLLEAMAARLPVVATPAGDAGVIAEEGRTGFVVPHDDIEAMAARLALLASSRELRLEFGAAGRAKVESSYTCEALPGRIMAIHRAIAEQLGHRRGLEALPSA